MEKTSLRFIVWSRGILAAVSFSDDPDSFCGINGLRWAVTAGQWNFDSLHLIPTRGSRYVVDIVVGRLPPQIQNVVRIFL